MNKIITIAAALLVAGTAQAQTRSLPVYAELGYVGLNYTEDGVPDLKPGALRLLVGVDVHPNVAIEGMIGGGVKDDDFSGRVYGYAVNGTAKVDRAWGFYVKPKVNPTPELTLFARLGYADTRVKWEASVAGQSFSAHDSGNDVSYGVGLAYAFTKNVFAAADYMSYYNKDGVKVDGFSFGLGVKF